MFRDLSPMVLTFIVSESLKLSFIVNCVLERAYDFKPVRDNKDLLLSEFEVSTVS